MPLNVVRSNQLSQNHITISGYDIKMMFEYCIILLENDIRMTDVGIHYYNVVIRHYDVIIFHYNGKI